MAEEAEESEETEEAPARRPPPPKPSILRTLMITAVLLSFLILLDEGLRETVGSTAGVVLTPAFGFGGSYPLLTFLVVGSLTTVVNSLARHFTSDWVRAARVNKNQRALQKARMEAMRHGNAKKLERLSKVQAEMQKETASLMFAGYKPLGYTSLPFSIFFSWVYLFIATEIVAQGRVYFTVPWSVQASLLANYLFPSWMLLYIALGIPISQVGTRLLKLFSFRKRLAALEAQGGAG